MQRKVEHRVVASVGGGDAWAFAIGVAAIPCMGSFWPLELLYILPYMVGMRRTAGGLAHVCFPVGARKKPAAPPLVKSRRVGLLAAFGYEWPRLGPSSCTSHTERK